MSGDDPVAALYAIAGVIFTLFGMWLAQTVMFWWHDRHRDD